MVTERTLRDIKTNVNTGIEYEIALFRCLLTSEKEAQDVETAIHDRTDAAKIISIIRYTSVDSILRELRNRSLVLEDVLFETQNDDVGPSDIVMLVRSAKGDMEQIGISVKYSNTCTLNVTGKRFLTEAQILALREKLPVYTDEFISEMTRTYGSVTKWFHKKKTSIITDTYIDLIRDEVILNWVRKTDAEKREILSEAYQETALIPYWVYTYTRTSFELDTNPYKIDMNDVPLVELRKYQTSYIGFYLREQLIGKMQVKFNNGFVEKCKKSVPDRIVDGVPMCYGRPFSSWNFSLV